MTASARPQHRRLRARRQANLVTLLREKKARRREREQRLVGKIKTAHGWVDAPSRADEESDVPAFLAEGWGYFGVSPAGPGVPIGHSVSKCSSREEAAAISKDRLTAQVDGQCAQSANPIAEMVERAQKRLAERPDPEPVTVRGFSSVPLPPKPNLNPRPLQPGGYGRTAPSATTWHLLQGLLIALGRADRQHPRRAPAPDADPRGGPAEDFPRKSLNPPSSTP